MSSEDISLVSKILAGVNSTDATIRTEAAKKLGELRQNLGAISFCLLQISSLQATTPEEVTVKTTALVILRKILDLEGEEKWKAIDNNLKEQIKKKALEAIPQVQTAVVCRKTGTASVTLSENIPEKILREAIEAQGYRIK